MLAVRRAAQGQAEVLRDLWPHEAAAPARPKEEGSLSCTIDLHEAEKQSPVALAENYDAHAEPWVFEDEVLAMFTCRRCRSTICIPVVRS